MPVTPSTGIDLIVMDVDGVLTDGGIIVDDDGRETKRFDVTDGLAIVLCGKVGITTAIITGRTSKVVTHRAADLSIAHVYQGSKDKLADLRSLWKATGLLPERTAFIGDDWPDLTAMRAVSLAIAPANAAPEVKAVAHMVTTASGGRGAVRQALEHILRVSGRHQQALSLYDPAHPTGAQ